LSNIKRTDEINKINKYSPGVNYNPILIKKLHIKSLIQLIDKKKWLNAGTYLIEKILQTTTYDKHYYIDKYNYFYILLLSNKITKSYILNNHTIISKISSSICKILIQNKKDILRQIYNEIIYNEIIYLNILGLQHPEEYYNIIKYERYDKNKIIFVIEEWLKK